TTMINQLLYKSLPQNLYKPKPNPPTHKQIKPLQHLHKLIHIHQSPIRPTPPSNPPTYTPLFHDIPHVFPQTN
ncbi:hypothetical protein, partial [Bacillus thuringiensis]|uniref:hypothetical protein n=1 Tax=Bacillus thuringiensis TaxID=1428 RepID=UPI0021B16AFF